MTDLDRYTLDQLYDLHHETCEEGRRFHEQIMRDGKPSVSTFSDTWRVISARCAELHEHAEMLYAEITRREQETRTDA